MHEKARHIRPLVGKGHETVAPKRSPHSSTLATGRSIVPVTFLSKPGLYPPPDLTKPNRPRFFQWKYPMPPNHSMFLILAQKLAGCDRSINNINHLHEINQFYF
jgi:hypothetical protein